MDLVCSLRSQSVPQAPSLVGMGAPSGRRRLRVRGVLMFPFARCKFRLDFRASGLRAGTFTPLLLVSLLMWP
ncbi:hypothetical protein NDU88_008051 [Pleurodeles waltl]|uniref:Uncharacterized protein n=1 Tax=Pleurodeles waltl TaxID=8319 RepID=A0AAV7RUY7_PLEWA|nr:hypothetical protein NDU88_008051 [Pleurodeles waltl]